MVSKSISAPERVIAAVLFTLLGLTFLVFAIGSKFTFWSFLCIVGLLLVGAALYGRFRDIFAAGAFAFMVLVLLILFFRGFSAKLYHGINWRNGDASFNLLYLLPTLIRLAAWVLLARLAALNFLDESMAGMLGSKEKANRRWYLPALLLFIADIVGFIALVSGGYWVGSEYELINIFASLLLIPAFIFGAMWIIGMEPEGYFSIALHIALTIFTMGLWYVVWVWHVTRHLNKVNNEETRGPTASLLLCLFLPFYAVYWNYASAQRVDRMARQNGVNSKLDVLSLVLGLVVGFLPSILMQDKLNRIDLVQRGVFTPDFTPETVNPLQQSKPAPALDETLPEL